MPKTIKKGEGNIIYRDSTLSRAAAHSLFASNQSNKVSHEIQVAISDAKKKFGSRVDIRTRKKASA